MTSVELLAALTWTPGFKGVLTVALSVVILCGGVALIVGTNSGARLGFQISLAALLGWFVVMGIIWAMYGIGYKGPAPTWHVVDVVQGPPSGSRIPVAEQLPMPSDLPDAVELRDGNEDFLAEFPTTGRNPNLGDLVMLDEDLKTDINDQVAPWRILETSNKYTGEAQSVVAASLGPDGQGRFESASDYVVIDSFITGGKSVRTDDSIIGRVKYKFTSAFQFGTPNFYAAVQLQPVIPQQARPGQAPPLPVANPNAPIYTVVLERDRGALRLPAIGFTVVSAAGFVVTAGSLHRRDKLATAQRAATAGAA